MKKLLYITSDPWWDTDITILPQLSKMFEVNVFVSSPSDISKNKYPDKVVDGNIIIHNFKYVRTQYNPLMFFFSLYYCLRLILALRKNDYVFWIVDNIVYYSIPFSWFCNKNKTILSYHNYVQHINKNSISFKQFNYLLSKFKLFHFHSRLQQEIFEKDHPFKKSFSTNMAIKYFGEPYNKQPLFNNRKRTFLFLGIISDYKRPDMFAKIAKKYKNDANFIIAGKLTNASKYYNLLKEYEPYYYSDFKFLSNDEIAYYYTNSNFLILPYDDTTQSGPLLVAYAYNIPIIATKQPYFETMIQDKTTGYLFDSGSLEQLDKIVGACIRMTDSDYSIMASATKEQTIQYLNKTDFASELQKFIILIEKNKN